MGSAFLRARKKPREVPEAFSGFGGFPGLIAPAAPASARFASVAVAQRARIFTGEDRAPREVDPALRIDLDDFNHDLVADLDDVFDPLDASRRELADVNEAFLAW